MAFDGRVLNGVGVLGAVVEERLGVRLLQRTALAAAARGAVVTVTSRSGERDRPWWSMAEGSSFDLARARVGPRAAGP
jgi:hypothetical protein